MLQGENSATEIVNNIGDEEKPKSHWSNLKPPETKSRDEEMEEYLEDLLL